MVPGESVPGRGATAAAGLPAPGARLDAATMPAHWLLARLGKKVMRPGGLPVTRAMLDGLAIGPGDDVVDLAPGLGVTVQLVEAARPASFTGLERGDIEAERSRRLVSHVDEETRSKAEVTERRPYRCVVAQPESTGLEPASATVVYGEAVLSLETDATKEAIIAEAARVLVPGGRLGLHELLLRPDDVDAKTKQRMETELTRTLRVRSRPLTTTEWCRRLEAGGFEVTLVSPAPLLLLSLPTFVRDEGLAGTARFLGRTVVRPAAARRLALIWRTFQRDRHSLGAIALVARKR